MNTHASENVTTPKKQALLARDPGAAVVRALPNDDAPFFVRRFDNISLCQSFFIITSARFFFSFFLLPISTSTFCLFHVARLIKWEFADNVQVINTHLFSAFCLC